MSDEKTLNRLAVLALLALVVLAVVARAWLGWTPAGQLDPVALSVSCAVALGGFAAALFRRSERASD